MVAKSKDTIAVLPKNGSSDSNNSMMDNTAISTATPPNITRKSNDCWKTGPSTKDCLETSLRLLHTSVEQAKESAAAYSSGEMCHSSGNKRSGRNGESKDGKDDEEEEDDDVGINNIASDACGDGTISPASYNWWMGLFQRLQESHASDRKQWQDDLKEVQQSIDSGDVGQGGAGTSAQIKREMRNNMEKRLQWLEEQLTKQVQQDAMSAASGSVPGVSRSHGSSASFTEDGYEANDDRSNRKFDHHHYRTHQSVDDESQTASERTPKHAKNSAKREASGTSSSDIKSPSPADKKKQKSETKKAASKSPGAPQPPSTPHGDSTTKQGNLSARPGFGDDSDANTSQELSYDGSIILKRLGELERAVAIHEHEKTYALEQANRVKEQGEQLTELSETMQDQLIQLMREVETASKKQTKKWKEKVGVQKQLLSLLEQQHVSAAEEWKKEKDLLENTVAQLSADKVKLKSDLEKEKARNPQKEKEAWTRERIVYDNTIAQLTADKMQLQKELNQVRAAAKLRKVDFIDVSDVGDGTKSTISSASSAPEIIDAELVVKVPESPRSCLKRQTSSSVGSTGGGNNHPQSSPRRVQWEDKLDRALVERDMYKQEVEKLEKQIISGDTEELLRMKESKWKAKAEQDLSQVQEENKLIIDNLILQLESLKTVEDEVANRSPAQLRQVASEGDSSTTARQMREDTQHLLRSRERKWKEDTDRQLKALRDEYTSIIETLEQQLDDKAGIERYRISVEKRNELIMKLKHLERHHDDEKGQWKLKLEAALVQTRTAEEAKEELERQTEDLEGRISALQEAYDGVVIELDELRLGKEEAGCEREEQLESELFDLKERYALETEQWNTMLVTAKDNHAKEISKYEQELEASKDETRALIEKTNHLVHSLEDLKKTHQRAKEKWESQLLSVVSEKDSQILELELLVNSEGKETDVQDTQKRQLCLEDVQGTIYNAIEDLRKDVVVVRETLETSTKTESAIANANHIELCENVGLMQSSLNDALAELTLGTESLIEMKALTEEISKNAHQRPDGSSVATPINIFDHQQASAIVDEIGELRNQLSSFIENQKENGSAVDILQDSMRQGLVAELQRKEMELAVLRGQLDQCRIDLESEKNKLLSAEAEIVALNDQADAYSDELMRMQALNAAMEEAIEATERKMESVLSQPTTPSKKSDDDSPFLDEALALAKGLTNLVHGDDDTDIMDMLRNLSDLMDQQDRGEWAPPASDDVMEEEVSGEERDPADTFVDIPSETPRSEFVRGALSGAKLRDSVTSELPPAPIETPYRSTGMPWSAERSVATRPDSSVQVIVEQLYGRCQLLERERTQMMEVTLDLLTSARQASATEMEAALATARRKAMEEVARVNQQTQIEKERLYHKLCGSCAKDILISKASDNTSSSDAAVVATTTSGGI